MKEKLINKQGRIRGSHSPTKSFIVTTAPAQAKLDAQLWGVLPYITGQNLAKKISGQLRSEHQQQQYRKCELLNNIM